MKPIASAKTEFQTKVETELFGFKPKLIRTIQLETGLQALEYTTTDSKISKTKKQLQSRYTSLVALDTRLRCAFAKTLFYLWFETEFETELKI